MALQARTRVGAYEIFPPLGTAVMGEVYRARDMKLQRYVALKILPASMAEAWLHPELSGKEPDE